MSGWPKYVSHKVVQALPIVGIGPAPADGSPPSLYVNPPLGDTAERFVPTEPAMAHRAELGGYAVIYADGFRSASPKAAFEEGYTPTNLANGSELEIAPDPDPIKSDPDDEPDGMLAYALSIKNPSRGDPNWPPPSFDAKDWAEAFCKRFPAVPVDVALAWFASALMRGYDEHSMRVHAGAVTDDPANAADLEAILQQPDRKVHITADGKVRIGGEGTP